MLLEQVCRRDCNCAYLVKCKNREPELIMTLEDNHNPVALLDAERFKVVRRLSGIFHHVLE